MKTHKDLDVWKKSIQLAKSIYALTANLPREERYTISDQMKRSAVSIASNIAEGAARQTNKEFVQFLYIALGSASELDTQLEICKSISFKALNNGSIESIQSDVIVISKMLYGLISKIKKNSKAGTVMSNVATKE